MRTLFILLILITAALPALAFPRMSGCESTNEAELMDEADVAGYGEVVTSTCDCSEPSSSEYACTTRIKIKEPAKGGPGTVGVTFTDNLMVGAPRPDICQRYKKNMESKVGTRKMYYFKKNAGGFSEVPSDGCSF